MDINLLKPKLTNIPHMRDSQADEITRLILENKFQNILELGFRHGVSTCYMAAAIDELNGGHITTIDLQSIRSIKPNIEELLESFNLRHYVTVHYEPTSYIWRLMKLLESDPSPRFDFCYLDGAHSWFVDGFAFFLVDRLLKPGGLIVFDDLDWTYENSPALKKTEFVKNMPIDEKTTPQIRKVYELLVKTHPGYGEFVIRGDWAYATKLSHEAQFSDKVRKEIVYEKEYVGFAPYIFRKARNLAKKLRV